MCAEVSKRDKNNKVLFIFDSKFSEWKGTQKFFYEFGDYLKKNGYTITLLENDRNSKINILPNGMVLPFTIISCRFRKILSIYFIPRKIIDDINPTTIYVNSFNTLPTIPRSNYKVIFGMHVVHVSSLKYMKMGKIKFRLKSYIFKFIAYLFWKNKDIMIHALNDDQSNWVKKILKNKFPVKVIGNPVACQLVENKEFIEHMRKNDKFTLLFFGSLSKDKGFGKFLKILDYVEKSCIKEKISFIIAGAGVLRQEAINRVIEYNNIIFIEKPDDKRKKELMLSSDLFIFPSINENYPITAVEAQSSGLPCLFSDIIPFRKIVITDKTGYCLSLNHDFEKQFFIKIINYLKMWQTQYKKYIKLRLDIVELSRTLCKENVLPQLLDMMNSFSNSKN